MGKVISPLWLNWYLMYSSVWGQIMKSKFHCRHHEAGLITWGSVHMLPAVLLNLGLWQRALMRADIEVAELLAMWTPTATAVRWAEEGDTCTGMPRHAPSPVSPWGTREQGRRRFIKSGWSEINRHITQSLFTHHKSVHSTGITPVDKQMLAYTAHAANCTFRIWQPRARRN